MVIILGNALLRMLKGAAELSQLRFLPLVYVVAAAGLFTFISGVIYVMDGVRQLQAEGHANAKVG